MVDPESLENEGRVLGSISRDSPPLTILFFPFQPQYYHDTGNATNLHPLFLKPATVSVSLTHATASLSLSLVPIKVREVPSIDIIHPAQPSGGLVQVIISRLGFLHLLLFFIFLRLNLLSRRSPRAQVSGIDLQRVPRTLTLLLIKPHGIGFRFQICLRRLLTR
ncbi:hypothetical protein F4778DRAFT_740015 [Xylariomycetidae sp. FL2044]|nr:hypothetical protein F4778DRAFT_740015 [Xylariomycetidae sp. FL2044]